MKYYKSVVLRVHFDQPHWGVHLAVGIAIFGIGRLSTRLIIYIMSVFFPELIFFISQHLIINYQVDQIEAQSVVFREVLCPMLAFRQGQCWLHWAQRQTHNLLIPGERPELSDQLYRFAAVSGSVEIPSWVCWTTWTII